MVQTLEDAVATQYGAPDLVQRIEAAQRAAGLGERIAPEALAPIDEFHIGGRAATKHAFDKMSFAPTGHVLDVGCGLGGATRYLATTYGCRVSGIDLTPDYIAAAQMLAARTGLEDRVDYRVASALAMPFPEATFDAAVTLHVAMNIADRTGLYREVARVLKPGAQFCIYDVMRGAGPSAALTFPQPWAETPAMSHLTSPEEMRALLAGAGFEVLSEEDRSAFGINFFRQRLAAPGGPTPPLGLHVLMGPRTRDKFANLLAGLEAGCVTPVVMMATRLSR
jgi:ubiquinone/menaquinone biosynthesis C-methylase UbiE